ncbi:MAG: glycine cleavage system protein GcvH [Actinobacteria bacterium]|nr:glycine cleavage system protein GcvH [Actinomycetota bacterium]OJU82753.1 MAG: glycine cleavage system protein H [Solirubrobacterales bacterium 70-9]
MAEPSYPDDLLYNAEHDWARVEGAEATFGITWYAQEQLGEIVFWDGAEVGAAVTMGANYTELESVKAVSEVIAPLSGTVLAVNDTVLQDPAKVNESPYEDGWLVRVTLTAPDEVARLLSPAAYRELIG